MVIQRGTFSFSVTFTAFRSVQAGHVSRACAWPCGHMEVSSQGRSVSEGLTNRRSGAFGETALSGATQEQAQGEVVVENI